MNSKLAFGIVLLAAMTLIGCASRSSAPDVASFTELSGTEIRQTLIGNTLHREGGDLFRSWQFAELFHPNGTMNARVWWSGSEELADGTWEVDQKGLFCRKWNNEWGQGKRGCFRVSRAEDSIAFDHASGSRGDADRYVYKFLQGNPYELD
jgi:hypothetical protein